MDFTIREAQPDDAEAIIAYMHELSDEPNISVPIAPGEFDMSVEDERAFIQRQLSSDNAIFLLALHGDKIIGAMNVTGGKRKAMRHAAHLGISIHRDWRDKGVGRAMMAYALEWARGTGIL